MNKLLSSLLISSVVICVLTIFGSSRQSIAAADTLFGPVQQNAPLTLSKLQQLLEHGTPDPTIAALIRRNGIAFQPTAALLARLRRMNYPQTLQALEAMRRPVTTPKPKPNNTGKDNRIKEAEKKPEETQTDTATDPNTVTILVANFSGPDPQNYLVTEKIIQGLRAATSEYSDISVQPLGEAITEQTGSKGGSAYARDIGTKRKAGIVLWGYYGATSEHVDVSAYFEVLQPPKRLSLRQNFETKTLPIADLKGFKIQTPLSKEMSYLVLLTVGIARYESGDYEGAISRFTKALAQSNAPDQIIAPADIYYYRGAAYYLKAGANGFDHAITDFDEVIELQPDNAKAYYNRGTVYSRKGRHDLAIADFDKAIGLKPDLVEAYNNRGNAYHEKGQHDLAIADFDKAIGLKPDNALAYNNRGTAYNKKGQRDLAIADYSKAIGLKPDYALAYNNRGTAYHEQGQRDLALADLDKAIKLKPDLAEAYYNRGLVYYAKGQWDLAIANYSKAIGFKPDLVEAYYNRGLIYQAKGQRDLALADLDKAIDLKPVLAEAYNNRGNAYHEKGQDDLALADFDKAIKLKPNLAGAYYNRAHLYQKKGERDRAIADLKSVLQITNDPEIRKEAEKLLQELGAK